MIPLAEIHRNGLFGPVSTFAPLSKFVASGPSREFFKLEYFTRNWRSLLRCSDAYHQLEFPGMIGNRIFGCDLCQEVCPVGRKGRISSQEPTFQPREITTKTRLVDLLRMTEEEFRKEFKGSPVKRTKWRGLMRNVAAGLSSSDDPEAEAALEMALEHPEGLVRSQAARSLAFTRQGTSINSDTYYC